MPLKKKAKKAKAPVVETPSAEEPMEVKIAAFSGSFNRVDLDLLRDKVNEIIDLINKQ